MSLHVGVEHSRREERSAPQCCEVATHKNHTYNSISDFLLDALEKISAVALGIFAAYTNSTLFSVSFGIGIGIGICNYYKQTDHHVHKNGVSGCSQGFLEQLTGVKLPRPISILANFAVTICHIDHHEPVFVPIVGVTLGAWVGEAISHQSSSLSRLSVTKMASPAL